MQFFFARDAISCYPPKEPAGAWFPSWSFAVAQIRAETESYTSCSTFSHRLSAQRAPLLSAALQGHCCRLISSKVECKAAFEHLKSACDSVDCIVYSVTGFTCQKLPKNTSCTWHKHGSTEPGETSDKPEADLVHCKTLGALVHFTKLISFLPKATEEEFKRNGEQTTDNIAQS